MNPGPASRPDTRFDVLIRGCTVVTGVPTEKPLADAAIGIVADRIAYVGSSDPSHQGRREIDGTGSLATPGFVNVHTHAILAHARGMTEDMGFAPAYTPGVPHAYDVREDEAVALARLGALEALKFGSTLINDMYIHARATLPAMAEIGGRISSAVWIHDVDFTGVHERRFEYDPAIGRRTLEDALELYASRNKSFNGRVTVMLAPHAIDTCSCDFLAEVARHREDAGGYVMTHLAQSRQEVEQVRARDGKTPAEVVDDAGLLDDRLIGTHCVVMTDSDIERVGKARMVVAHAPKINMTGGYLPMTSRLRRAGAQVALGTDNMHADIIEVLRWALISGRLQERAVNDYWDSSQVFYMATKGAADAIGRGHDLGTLEVGKKADVVLFDMKQAHLTPGFDPVATIVHAGQGRDVHAVMVDGRVVVEDGRATLVDEERVIQEAREAADRLWTRIQGHRPGTVRSREQMRVSA